MGQLLRPFRGCRATKSATQAVGAGAASAILFDTEDYDTSAMHDTVTNTSRITIPPGVSFVELSGTVAVQNISASEYNLYIRKNGAGVLYGYDRIVTVQEGAQIATLTSRALTTSTGPLAVVPGDYFELMWSMNQATTVDTTAAAGTVFACTVLG